MAYLIFWSMDRRQFFFCPPQDASSSQTPRRASYPGRIPSGATRVKADRAHRGEDATLSV